MMREAVSLMGGYGVTEDCPGFLGPEMDGRATGSHLRRPGGGAAVAAFHHDDQPAVPRAVHAMDFRDEAHRLRPPRHRRLRARHGDEALALDAAPHPNRHGCRRRQALPQDAPGRDLPAGRRAVLAAGRAAVHPRRYRVGNQGRGRIPALADGLAGTVAFFTDLCHVQCGPRRRRNRPHLRRNRPWLQSSSRVG